MGTAVILPIAQGLHRNGVHVTSVIGGWNGTLSNNGEEIELDDATGERIDRVSYADEGDWALRRPGPLDNGATGWDWVAEHDGGGRSLELVNRQLSNQRGCGHGNCPPERNARCSFQQVSAASMCAKRPKDSQEENCSTRSDRD